MSPNPSLILVSLVAMIATAACGVSDDSVLLQALFRYRIADWVVGQAAQLAAGTAPDVARQVHTCANDWKSDLLRGIRLGLDRHFGPRARDVFQKFVADFTQAEKAGDLGFLRALALAAKLDPIPSNYHELSRRVSALLPESELKRAVDFLSDVETWLTVRARNDKAPPLDLWLSRGNSGKDRQPVSPPPHVPAAANPLREAEGPAEDFALEPGEKEQGGLAALSASRAEKRAKVLEQAQSSMQQVAAERQAAEQEYAAAKTAAAQAESEAMRKHAETLAAAEQEALEQRRNSWGNRLKQIVSTTIGSAGGAFFGGVGARAGEAAADAVFKDKE